MTHTEGRFDYDTLDGLRVDTALRSFIETQVLPGAGVDAASFWAGFSALVNDFGPKNRALLQKREDIQGKIDAYHVEKRDNPHDRDGYKAFLEEIGT